MQVAIERKYKLCFLSSHNLRSLYLHYNQFVIFIVLMIVWQFDDCGDNDKGNDDNDMIMMTIMIMMMMRIMMMMMRTMMMMLRTMMMMMRTMMMMMRAMMMMMIMMKMTMMMTTKCHLALCRLVLLLLPAGNRSVVRDLQHFIQLIVIITIIVIIIIIDHHHCHCHHNW